MTDLITVIDQEPRVSHISIAENIDYENVSIRKLIDNNISDFEEFGQLSFQMTTVKNSVGAVNEKKIYFLNEPQATLLMTYLKNTNIVKQFKKTLVKAFYELRDNSIQPQTPNIETKKDKLEIDLLGLEFATKLLRVNETSKISMTKKLFDKYNMTTNYLPNYTEEDVTFSATQLLKEFDVNLSAVKLNKILIEKGYIELKYRNSSKGTQKSFKSLTDKGLEFGKNLINEKSPKETQPHFYKSKFLELIELVGA
jgi:phage regulator Rha-like protein